MNEYKLLLHHTPQTEWTDQAFLLEMSAGAVGGGMFIAGALFGNAWICAIGWILACACKGLLLLADLGVRKRFAKAFAKPFKSWLSFGAWAMLFFGAFGFIYVCQAVFSSGPGSGLSGFVRFLAVISALVLIFYDGMLMASSKGISAWSSGMLAPLFGVNALATGCAVVLFAQPAQGLLLLTLGLVLAEGLILLCHVAALGKGATGARVSKEILLTGEQKTFFLGGAVLAGIVLPLLLLMILQFGGFELSRVILALNAVLLAGGVYYMRTSLLKSGVTTPAL